MPVWPGGHGSNKLHEVGGVIGQVFSVWNSLGPFLVSFEQFWSKKIFQKNPAGRTDERTDGRTKPNTRWEYKTSLLQP